MNVLHNFLDVSTSVCNELRLSRLSLSEKYGQFGYWWYSKVLSFWVEYHQYLNLLCTDISINYISIEWNTAYANEPHRIHTLAHFFLHDSMNYQWLKWNSIVFVSPFTFLSSMTKWPLKRTNTENSSVISITGAADCISSKNRRWSWLPLVLIGHMRRGKRPI